MHRRCIGDIININIWFHQGMKSKNSKIQHRQIVNSALASLQKGRIRRAHDKLGSISSQIGGEGLAEYLNCRRTRNFGTHSKIFELKKKKKTIACWWWSSLTTSVLHEVFVWTLREVGAQPWNYRSARNGKWYRTTWNKWNSSSRIEESTPCTRKQPVRI